MLIAIAHRVIDLATALGHPLGFRRKPEVDQRLWGTDNPLKKSSRPPLSDSADSPSRRLLDSINGVGVSSILLTFRKILQVSWFVSRQNAI
jgi:hypothetical protein